VGDIHLIDGIFGLVGNFGVAILIVTLMLKIANPRRQEERNVAG
jgi:hypothetical protein